LRRKKISEPPVYEKGSNETTLDPPRKWSVMPLSQGVLSVCSQVVYNFLVSFFLRKSDTKFLLASLKTLHYLLKLLFRELVVADRKPPVTLRLALKPGCISENSVGNPHVTCIGRRIFPPSNER
jgi:hypothetical protein